MNQIFWKEGYAMTPSTLYLDAVCALHAPWGPALADGAVLPASPVVVTTDCTSPITGLPGSGRARSEVALCVVALVPILANSALPVARPALAR